MSIYERSREMVEIVARRLGFLRVVSYKRVFHDAELPGNVVSRDASHVLADLRKFAWIGKHSFGRDQTNRIDPIAMARIEGRREVFYRIMDHLNLDETAIQTFMEVSVDE